MAREGWLRMEKEGGQGFEYRFSNFSNYSNFSNFSKYFGSRNSLVSIGFVRF